MEKSILVLEGGAMRSLYTSGVLDVFMKQNININDVIGVSAGALVGSNYVSNQKGRTACININYCKDKRYIGTKAIKNNKGLVGFDYMFGEIAKEKVPFDEESFFNSKKRFIVGVTNCNSGKTEYFEKDNKDIYKVMQASASMPLISQIVMLKGKPYLDGAIDCNIPIDWAIENGYKKIIVVLTREKDYRKPPLSNKMKKIYSIAYKKYPKLVQSLYERAEKYNQLYERMEQLEKENKIIIFRPLNNINVSRLERNEDKLRDLYEQGIDETERRIDELKKYLEA